MEPPTTTTKDSHSRSNATSNTSTMDVSSADCLRLILAHLTESGLHETAQTLRRESGVGSAASFLSNDSWHAACASGQWATVLRGLAALDRDRARLSPQLLAGVHEMAVLELAQAGDWDAAHAVFRLLLQGDEPLASAVSELTTKTGSSGKNKATTTPVTTVAVTVRRSLEQKLAQLAAARQKDPRCAVPDDYYGTSSTSSSSTNNRQMRREALGRQLRAAVPRQPPHRLVALLQQAVQWQSHTAQLPRVKRWWQDDDSDDGVDEEDDGEAEESDDAKPAKKKRKRKRKRKKEFDLVLGEVSVDPSTTVAATASSKSATSKHIARDYATVSFGKKATCESAVFLPGAGTNGGLVTGSSDGLIEVHDLQGQLRTTDLPYQARDEFMGHDSGSGKSSGAAAVTALAVSNDGQLLASGGADGTVHVWRIDTGKRLRTLSVTTSSSSSSSSTTTTSHAVSCLALAPHGTQVLVGLATGDCREFGLRSGRVLREFKGHGAYLTHCLYRLTVNMGSGDDDDENNDDDGNGNGGEQLVVVTASGDGSVRFWNAQTADLLQVWQPASLGKHLSAVGSSLVVSAATATGDDRPAVLGLHPLHAPAAHAWIVVPRGRRAFLVDCRGRVLQIYQDDTAREKEERVFVASAVSASNRWLYAVRDDGACCIFDVATGKLHDTLRDFGSRSTAKGGKAEVSCLVHHSAKDLVAAFSNDKGQKKGRLVLWKA